jgi:hypothetical protein
MDIKIPSRDSIGFGKFVKCSECGNSHNIGSMITVETIISGNTYIYKVCSVGCLDVLLKVLKV